MARRGAQIGAVVDVFACALDQIGIAEMRCCVEKTGGFLVQDDSFTHGVFMGSLKRALARRTADDTSASADSEELQTVTQTELTVLTSREIRIAGAIGHIQSIAAVQPERKLPAAQFAQVEVGVGQTNCWYLGGCDPASTVAVFFEIANPAVGLYRGLYLSPDSQHSFSLIGSTPSR